MKEKQGMSTSQPLETAPPTTTTAVPLVVPAIGTSVTDTSAAATTILDTSMSMEKMMKEIKVLELQMAELKEAKEKLAKLEVSYDKSKITVAEKTREVIAFENKVKSLENKVKSLEKDLTLHKPLSEIKTIFWTKIG